MYSFIIGELIDTLSSSKQPQIKLDYSISKDN